VHKINTLPNSNIKIVVAGSFRKHFAPICAAVYSFRADGFTVLSPEPSHVVNPKDEFAILDSDVTDDPKLLQQVVLDKIALADALYICNPGGYVGSSATMELGWALALNKPVFTLEQPTDFTLKLFAPTIAKPTEVRAHLDRFAVGNQRVSQGASLADLQAYIGRVVVERGFGEETPLDIMLLLVEEVGELAKAIRRHAGIKIDETANEHGRAPEELADVLSYVLNLANQLNVDLIEAFRDKERINAERIWKIAS
jgi:NTP pyrophosphatase (non-canonical NTP hydrolase)